MKITFEQIGEFTKCDSCGGNFTMRAGGLLAGNLECPYCKNKVEVIANTPEGVLLKYAFKKFESDKEGTSITFYRDSAYSNIPFATKYVIFFLSIPLMFFGYNNIHGLLFKQSHPVSYIGLGLGILGMALLSFVLKGAFSMPKIKIRNGLVEYRHYSKNLQGALSVYGFSKISGKKIMGSGKVIDPIYMPDRHFVLIHFSDGSIRLLPFHLHNDHIDLLIIELNRALKINQKIIPHNIDKKHAPLLIRKTGVPVSSSSKPWHGRINGNKMKIKGKLLPEKAECISCGAISKLPSLLKTSEQILCKYCHSTLKIRSLEHEDLIDRIIMGNSKTENSDDFFILEDKRLPYGKTETLHVMIYYCLVVWLFFIFISFEIDEYNGLASVFLFFIPCIYFSLRWQFRDENSSFLLFILGVFLFLLIFTFFIFSFFNVIVFIFAIPSAFFIYHKILGEINRYTIKIVNTGIVEKYIFGRKRKIFLGDIDYAVLYRWDTFNPFIESETNHHVAYHRNRAIWGFALSMKNGGTYLGKYLGEKSTADTIVRRINYELDKQYFQNIRF